MWVLAPINGLHVDRPVRIGIVDFVDSAVGQATLRKFDPSLRADILDGLSAASAFARVAVTSQFVYEAELDGLPLIDAAAAWLTARLRYSWSHLPDGRPYTYSRADTRVVVERLNTVCVLALDGPRRWWRGTTVARAIGVAVLGTGEAWSTPEMRAALPETDRHALLAIQRAATTTDPVQRVAALWEAVEFYVGDRGPAGLFSEDDIARVTRAATTTLTDERASRVRDVLRTFVNQPSIMARLQHVLSEDRVPLAADDLAVLKRLRYHRNRAVHGATAAPQHNDIDRALALLSRAITHRWYRADSP
jgi:hypothetical protein